jgi:type VI secretion system secreted protein Hcp
MLIKHCCKGEHFKTGVLSLRKAGGKGGPVEYLVIKLEEIIVSSYSTGGSGEGGEVVHENVSLNFAKFQIDYKGQGADGAAKAVVTAKWNIPKNCE